jgi:hypothetical protein
MADPKPEPKPVLPVAGPTIPVVTPTTDEIKSIIAEANAPLIKAIDDEKQARLKVELERASEKLTDLKKAALKKANLPEDLAIRIGGATSEEIAADVKSLGKLIGPAEDSGGAGDPASKAATRKLTLEAVRKMTPEERMKNMAQIDKQLMDGTLI